MALFSNRVAVLWAICLGALMVTSTAFAGDDDLWRLLRPLVWVDSKGRPIGRAVGSSAVQVRIGGLDLILPVTNIQSCTAPFTCNSSLNVGWGGNSLGPGAGAPIVYKDPKCGGEARLVSIAPGSARAVAVIGLTLDGQKLYIGVDGPSEMFTWQSQLFPEGACQDFPFPVTQPGWKIDPLRSPLPLKTLPYKTPFSLK